MAFPADSQGYDRFELLTNPAAQLTDFVFVENLARRSASWWSTVRSDGGNIRYTDDSDTQLPCDLIRWDYGNQTGLAAFKLTKLTTSQFMRCHLDAAGATLPAVDNAYGQYNVYPSAWYGFWPSGAGNDRTSRQNNLTPTGSSPVTEGDVAGPINGSVGTAYTSGNPTIKTAATVPGSTYPIAWLLSGYATTNTDIKAAQLYVEAEGAGDEISMIFNSTNGKVIQVRDNGGTSRFANSSPNVYTLNNYHRAMARAAGTTTRYAGCNGLVGSLDGAGAFTHNTFDAIALGTTFNGRLSFVRLSASSVDSTELAYDHAMYNTADQSTFYGSSTWSGGGSSAAAAAAHLFRFRRSR